MPATFNANYGFNMNYKNLILIDDDPDDREIFLDAILEASGHISCTAFENGELALEKLTAEAITPDAIFLDLNMPRMNGTEFLEKMRDVPALKNIPVIVYSTSVYIEASKSQLSGITKAMLIKPDTYDDLVVLLRDVLQE